MPEIDSFESQISIATFQNRKLPERSSFFSSPLNLLRTSSTSKSSLVEDWVMGELISPIMRIIWRRPEEIVTSNYTLDLVRVKNKELSKFDKRIRKRNQMDTILPHIREPFTLGYLTVKYIGVAAIPRFVD